ncbi:MAG TPA: 6-pyruvoyl-tetrahydropterin synthase-related protein [Patescibacteria group bacterium]|nr:6-pyruvoyl-tetrahydropterin synthase-related protein [Patescibacteria group bacterium]
MIVNSLIASGILIAVFLFWKYVFPKRNIWPIFIIIGVSILPLVSMLRPGIYESGDFILHTTWLMSFVDSLKEGILFPKWSMDLCGGYGCPLFTYFYVLPYYIASAFVFLGFSFVTSIKILLAFSFVLSGITSYVWLKKEFGSYPALIGAILYQFAPRHFVVMHFSTTIGETLGFALAPLVLLGVKLCIQKRTKFRILLLAASFALLILAHQMVTAIMLPFIFIYVLYCSDFSIRKSLHNLRTVTCVLAVSLLLTAYHWIPIVFETHLIHQSTEHNVLTYPLNEFLVSPWRYGLLYQGPQGQLSSFIGYAQITVLAVTFWFSKKNKILKYVSFLAIAIFIFMQAIFKPIWQTIPILNDFQSVHRLLIALILLASFSAALLVHKKYVNKKIAAVFALIAVAITILNWGNRGTLPISDAQIRANMHNQRGDLETTPIGSDVSKFPLFTTPITILSGNAQITQDSRTSVLHEYTIRNTQPVTIRENTQYFLNWKITDHGLPVRFRTDDPTTPGLMVYNLQPGTHTILVRFEETYLNVVGNNLSIVTLALVLFVFLLA